MPDQPYDFADELLDRQRQDEAEADVQAEIARLDPGVVISEYIAPIEGTRQHRFLTQFGEKVGEIATDNITRGTIIPLDLSLKTPLAIPPSPGPRVFPQPQRNVFFGIPKTLYLLKTYIRPVAESRLYLYTGNARPILIYTYQHTPTGGSPCTGDLVTIIGPAKLTRRPSGWSLQVGLVLERCDVNLPTETWAPADFIDIEASGGTITVSRRFSLSINNGAPVGREEPYALGSGSWYGGFMHEFSGVNTGLGDLRAYDPLFEQTGNAATIGGTRIIDGVNLGDGPTGSYNVTRFQRQGVDPGAGICDPASPLFAGAPYVPANASFTLAEVGEIYVDDTSPGNNAVVVETDWSGSFQIFGNTYLCSSDRFYRRLTFRRPDTAPSGPCTILGVIEPHSFQEYTGFAPVWMNPEADRVLMCELDYTFEDLDWASGGTATSILTTTTQRWFVVDSAGNETFLGNTLFGINQGEVGPGWNVFGVPRNTSTDEKFFTCTFGSDDRFEFHRMFFLGSERANLLTGTGGPYSKDVDLLTIDSGGESQVNGVDTVEYEGNVRQYFSDTLDPSDPYYLNPGGLEQLTIEGYFYHPDGWPGFSE